MIQFLHETQDNNSISFKNIIFFCDKYTSNFQNEGCTLTQFYKNMLQSSQTSQPTVYFSLTLLRRLIEYRTLKLSSCSISTLKDTITHTLTSISTNFSLKSLSHLRSIVAQKVSAGVSPIISDRDQESLVVLIMEAFLKSTTSQRYSDIEVIPDSSAGIRTSVFYSGLLVRTYSRQTRLMVKSLHSQSEHLKVVVLKTSVPYELESFEDEVFYFYNSTSVSLQDRYVSTAIEILSEQLNKYPVGVFACQKVVHAQIRSYLEQRGIIVLERVSGNYVEQLCSVSSTEVSPSISQWNVGCIAGMEIVDIQDKHFIHIKPLSDCHIGAVRLCSLVSF